MIPQPMTRITDPRSEMAIKKKRPAVKKKAGRPTAYKPEFCNEAFRRCLCGATDEQLADCFKINRSTLHRWKIQHTEFRDTIKRGKAHADGKVANALFLRALGYSHPEDRIFINDGKPLIVPTTKHYPPDTAAAYIWLKNRQPEYWRDKRETVLSGDPEAPIIGTIKTLSTEQLEEFLVQSRAALKGGPE